MKKKPIQRALIVGATPHDARLHKAAIAKKAQ